MIRSKLFLFYFQYDIDYTLTKTLLVTIGLDGATIRFTCFHPDITKTNEDLVGDYWPGVHLFPSRTEKLSPEPPMILGSNLVK